MNDLHYCEHCGTTSPDPKHATDGFCPVCTDKLGLPHYCDPYYVQGRGWVGTKEQLQRLRARVTELEAENARLADELEASRGGDGDSGQTG